MAIDRVVPLMLIALIAMIVPIMGEMPEDRDVTDDELLTYLSYNVSYPDELKPALTSIKAKEEVEIAGFTVASLLYAMNEKRRFERDCKYVSLSPSSGEIKESDLTRVLNVFALVNYYDYRRMQSCVKRIQKRFAKLRSTTTIRSDQPTEDELFAKLREKLLAIWEVRIIVQTIKNKERFYIGTDTLGDLWYVDRVDTTYFRHCEHARFLKSLRVMDYSDLTLALNVWNLAYSRRKDLRETCAERIKIVFAYNKLDAKQDENALTTDEIKLLEGAIKDTPSLKDCELDSFRKRRTEDGQREVSNVHKYINYLKFVSFCAKNFKTVYEKAVSDGGEKLMSDTENPCKPMRDHLDYIEYLIKDCEPESCKEGLKEIKSELTKLEDACKHG